MIESLTRVMVQSGAGWVLWFLFGLSFVSIAIGLERDPAVRRFLQRRQSALPARSTVARGK